MKLFFEFMVLVLILNDWNSLVYYAELFLTLEVLSDEKSLSATLA